MKNVMIIDGARNCAYDIFATTEEGFARMFPANGQDVAFIDEILSSGPRHELERLFSEMWARPVAKPDADGIHGIIFYELDFKKEFYPNRRDSDLTDNLSRAQR
jgi:hypothetical protein